jgi:hypothetical protein
VDQSSPGGVEKKDNRKKIVSRKEKDRISGQRDSR